MNPLKKLFKAKVPDNLAKYVGKKVIIPWIEKYEQGKITYAPDCKTTVVIETICGNRFRPNFYEINGTHLIGMLRFHAQMEKADDITEEQMLAFEAMEMEAKPMEGKDGKDQGQSSTQH